MAEPKDGCVQPAGGPIGTPQAEGSSVVQSGREESAMIARVGKNAPDFEASAFVDGAFKSLKLSEYKGKWVALCFYPGDFTFV